MGTATALSAVFGELFLLRVGVCAAMSLAACVATFICSSRCVAFSLFDVVLPTLLFSTAVDDFSSAAHFGAFCFGSGLLFAVGFSSAVTFPLSSDTVAVFGTAGAVVSFGVEAAVFVSGYDFVLLPAVLPASFSAALLLCRLANTTAEVIRITVAMMLMSRTLFSGMRMRITRKRSPALTFGATAACAAIAAVDIMSLQPSAVAAASGVALSAALHVEMRAISEKRIMTAKVHRAVMRFMVFR
ncbi:MAG: hypothetical protein MR292_01890 [Alistipes sp.]|nr:hypothetical protein [Alistipes sp.]